MKMQAIIQRSEKKVFKNPFLYTYRLEGPN